MALATLSSCTGQDGEEPPEVVSSEAVSSEAADENGSAVDTLVQTGLAQLEAGDNAAARGTFASVLALDPDNVLGHYNLGVIEQRAGRDAAALESYDAALATDPDHVPALFNKAILLETSDLPGAVELYRTVIDLDEERAAAHMRLGFALVHLGEKVEGEAALAEGLRLDPAMAQVEAPRYD